MIQKKDIEKLVIQNKKSTLKNHWYDSIAYNTTKYSGEIKPKEILLWKSSHFLRGAYPIFSITFDQNNKLIGIKTEKNPYHIFLNKIVISFCVLLIFIILFTTNFKTAIFGIIGFSIIGFLLNLILSKARKYEIKILTDELRDTIENIERLNYSELINKNETSLKKEKVKEWTFTKIITRFLLYPFCLFILWFSITGLLTEGKITHGIFGIVVSLAYIISDIILIIKKKKNYN